MLIVCVFPRGHLVWSSMRVSQHPVEWIRTVKLERVGSVAFFSVPVQHLDFIAPMGMIPVEVQWIVALVSVYLLPMDSPRSVKNLSYLQLNPNRTNPDHWGG